MTTARNPTVHLVAVLLTFLIVLAGAGVALYFVFDSVGLAIAPALIIAAAMAAAVHLSGRRKV